MRWIEHGYDLVWDKFPPMARHLKNSKSSQVHSDFVTKAIDDMLKAGAASALPPGITPTVVSPLGVVSKAHSTKLRLIVNMIYVNDHLAKRVFKFEGLTDLADMSEKGDFSISYDLTSGYYHVPLHPDSRRFVGFQWKGVFYQYNCLPFGLSTAPWVFSKIIRELVMYWRAKGINILPYLDDLLFLICGYEEGIRLRSIIERDMRLAGLSINWDKSDNNPLQERIHLGFVVNLAEGLFKIPVIRWESLHKDIESILNSHNGRVQARKLASVVGTIISMKLAWGPVTQLYTRNLYHIINNVLSLNCWVDVTMEAFNELIFWKDLPRLRFDSEIWPSTSGLSIKVATDASDVGWGGHIIHGGSFIAHEYFSHWESLQSSTYRELLGVTRCLQSLVLQCQGKFVVLQTDAMNLLGIINRGSSKLPLNTLARELFWFCIEFNIRLIIEWVPREENEVADEISKWLIPDDNAISIPYFNMLNLRWGPHTCDLFSSNMNNLCSKFYSLHWCRDTSGVNCFGFDWSDDNCWIHPPFRIIGKIWRKLMRHGCKATIIIPLWTSSTWWRLIAPDSVHLSNYVVDWLWVPRNDPYVFVPNSASGSRSTPAPNWQLMALRVDFSIESAAFQLSKRDRCVQEGCHSCSCNTWRRNQ
jgi:hypothetical protein